MKTLNTFLLTVLFIITGCGSETQSQIKLLQKAKKRPITQTEQSTPALSNALGKLRQETKESINSSINKFLKTPREINIPVVKKTIEPSSKNDT